ncbi:hypothetical protein NIES2134_100930 [Thermostichus vulcanus NIES-2134]|nr:hypothetical protein NIES2134_100930 [Thermostichus vulcanus NIES-2134]
MLEETRQETIKETIQETIIEIARSLLEFVGEKILFGLVFLVLLILVFWLFRGALLNSNPQTPRKSEEQSDKRKSVNASIALILQAKYAPSLKENRTIDELDELLGYIDKAAYYLVATTQEIDNIEKNLSLGELDDKAYEQDIYLRIDIPPEIPEEICNAKSKLAIKSFLREHGNELESKNFNFKVSRLKLRLSSRGLENLRS